MPDRCPGVSIDVGKDVIGTIFLPGVSTSDYGPEGQFPRLGWSGSTMNPTRVDFVVDLAYGVALFVAIGLILVVGTSVGIAFGLGVLVSYVIHIGWKMARFDPDWMTSEVAKQVEDTVSEEVDQVAETVKQTVSEEVDQVAETVEQTVSEDVTEEVEKTVSRQVEETVGNEVDEVIEKIDEMREAEDQGGIVGHGTAPAGSSSNEPVGTDEEEPSQDDK